MISCDRKRNRNITREIFLNPDKKNTKTNTKPNIKPNTKPNTKINTKQNQKIKRPDRIKPYVPLRQNNKTLNRLNRFKINK